MAGRSVATVALVVIVLTSIVDVGQGQTAECFNDELFRCPIGDADGTRPSGDECCEAGFLAHREAGVDQCVQCIDNGICHMSSGCGDAPFDESQAQTQEDCCNNGGRSYQNFDFQCMECFQGCFTDLGCGGDRVAVNTSLSPTEQIRECCLQTPALSYNFREQCVDCVAFGFLESRLSGTERGPGYTIEIGYIKRPPSVPSQFFRGMIEATSGSAISGEDFSLNSNMYTVRPNALGEILVRFLVDNVAQELVETAQLQLDILAGITLPPGLIIRDTITLEIIDSDIVVFQFTENDYRSAEDAGIIDAVISKTLRIANPVTFQVFPYTVQQAEDLGLDLSELNVPPDDNIYSLNRAQIDRDDRPPDFDNSVLTVTFAADEDLVNPVNDMDVPIPISDDDIDEAQEEVFIINMQLESAINQPGLQIDRASSLCRINDNDVIQIGFQNDSYTFPEPELLESHTIFLEKQNGTRTEQTYVVVVQTSQASPPDVGNAEPFDGTNTNDYTILLDNTADTVMPVFLPNEQILAFSFFLFGDQIAEGLEAFQVSSAADENPMIPAFSAPDDGVLFPTAFINIADDDDVIVGFEQNFTVPEDIGSVEVCFRVLFPPDNVSLTINIDLVVDSVEGTADEMDYTPIRSSAFNVFETLSADRRRACFNVTINADNVYEDTEQFSLVLNFDQVVDQVSIEPSVIYVQIEDTTPLTIGFIDPPYTSQESSLVSTFQVGVLGGTTLTRDVTVDFSTADSALGGGRDALEGRDYDSRTASLTFGPDITQLDVNVTLIDDEVFELTESFIGTLSVSEPVDRLTLAPDMAEAQIIDDDTLLVGYIQDTYQFGEESGQNNVGVAFSGATGEFDLNVNYQTVEFGSGERDAQADLDYESDNNSFSISIGLTAHPVTILSDNIAEYTESFGVELVDAFLTLGGNQIDLNADEAARISIDPATATIEIINDDVARIGFVQTTYEVSEPDSSVDFGIAILEGNLGVSVNFNFSTADGTAIDGSDYNGRVQGITFSSSVGSTDAPVGLINDDVYENTETFTGQLSGTLPPFVTLGPDMATAQINDDDEVVIGFRIVSDPMDVNEDAGPVIFEVEVLEGIISDGIEFQVAFFTRDGTAIANDDYIFLTQNLTFSSTSTVQQVSVTINDDDIFEDFETFTGNLMLLGNPERVTVAPDVANVRIVDEDTLRIGFLETDYSVLEAAGSSVGLRVGVIEGQLGRDINITFNTQDGTAMAGSDYIARLNEILQFRPTLSEDFTIPVSIVNNDAVEPIEVFQGLLSDPMIDRLSVDPGVADVTITDNDNATIGFDRAVYNVVENEVFSNVTIRLTGVINTPVTVRLTTADGSAVSIGPEADFVSHDMEYTFTPGGPTEIIVPIRILDDLRLENDEGLNTIISLTTDNTAINLGPADAMILIMDDDNVVIGFAQTLYRVTEGPGAIVDVVVMVIMGELRRDVVVNFFTEDGTALETQDYLLTTDTLTFNEGTSSFTISIPITDDNINEIVESFRAVLTTSDEDVILAPNVTTIEITDDNLISVSYRQPVYMFSEGSGVGLVCVDKIGATTQTITVIASGPLHGSGATGMEVLTFAPDETEQCFNFSVVDDNIALEITETLTWGLTIEGQPPLVELGVNPTTDILILDDDILTITVNKNNRVIESVGYIETCLIFSNPFAQDFSLDRATQLPPNASLPDDGRRAEDGTDYESVNDTLTINPSDGDDGQLCFNVTILDDQVVEDPLECFGMLLAIPESEVLRDSIVLSGGSLVCCIEDDDTVNIGFDPIIYNVHEGEGQVTLRVRVLDGSLARAIDAVLSTEDGTATSTAPVDYINPGLVTLQFDSQQQEQTVVIRIENDDIFENLENFFGNVESFDTAVSVTVPRAEVQISEDPDDNDRPTIGFVPDVYTVFETDSTVDLNVEIIRGTLERDVEVTFSTLSGTATQEAPEDYTGITTMTLLFTPTVSMVTVPVSIVNDNIVEDDETFTGNLGLNNPNDAFLLPDVATVTILGDDPDDRVVIGLERDYTVNEGDSVEVCAVLRSGVLERSAEVTLSSASGTATDGVDYESLLETLVFSPGVNRVCANLTTILDGVVEELEMLSVNLATDDSQVDLDPVSATVSIVDRDVVVVGLQETVYSVDEDEGSLEVCAEIVSGQLARDLEVTFTSTDGTASAPGDYSSVSQTLTFMDTDDVVCVNITIVSDSFYEIDETFTVTLTTEDDQASVQPDLEVATVTIVDDDELVIGFDPDMYSVSEDGGSVELCARILNGDLALEREVIVNAATSMADPSIYDSPATAGDDFDQVAVQLIFDRDNTRLCFMVMINQDDITEGTEVFTANIITDAPRVTLDPDTAVVSILDADAVVVGYRDQPYVFTEDGGLATVRVVVLGELSDELVVNIQTVDITGVNNAAIGDVDYIPVDMDLTFGPDVSSIIVNITLVNDEIFELNEIFNTNLTIVTEGLSVNIENNQPLAQIEIIEDDIVIIGFEREVYMTGENSTVEICARVRDDSPAQLGREVTVRITSSDGSAEAPSDYEAIAMDLIFSPTMTRVCVRVTITEDDIVEGEERFNVTLTTTDDVQLDPDEAVVIIEEDDMIRVTFTQPSYTFTENGVTGSVEVIKTGDTDEPFDVRVQGGPSTQTDIERSAAGIDVIITFQAGSSAPDSITIEFALTDDSVALEAIEQYIASLTILGGPVGVELGMFPTTEINVLDDDVVTVEFGTSSVTVSEEDEQFMMCVVLDRRTLQDVTVTIRADDITASTGSDYDATSIPVTVTVSAGDDRTCFTGDIINDLIPEPTESFTLTITNTSPSGVNVGVSVTEIFIADRDTATVRFERPEYTFSEDVGTGEVCLIKDAETVSAVTVQVTTAPGTATAGVDYEVGPYTVNFGTAANDRVCINVGIITDAETEDPETFIATIVTTPGSGATPGTPSTTEITITDTGVQVNDTAIGDPLMTVPLLVNEQDLAALNTSQISLCYEIHGVEDQYFNLVTDECTSVNAHYVDLTERLNVIGQIGVRATDNNDRCRNILVDVAECSAEIDGVALPVNGRFMEGGISVRRYANRVRISVPNCNELSLVMWVFCEARTLDDPEAPNGVIEGRMIKFVVMRGLNFGHRMAHGLIGQFWNIPARISPFTGLDRNGDPQPNRYIVNITGAQSGEYRAFTGWYYPLTWEFEEGPCLYVGNLQGGPIYEVTDPNDPVIEGTYSDYMVQSAFSEEEYDFGLFNEDRCATGTDTPDVIN